MTDENRSWKNSFKANIETLFEELRLAGYWRRPSLLFAVHQSIWGQKKAAARLRDMLTRIGYIIVELESSDEYPSMAHHILKQNPLENTVYFIFNLNHGGADERRTYRALNMYRELFIENRIKAVFWLTRHEAETLPLYAPDFWAFRHRTIEFGASHVSPIRAVWQSLAIWYGEQVVDLDLDEKLDSLEKSLSVLPAESESLSMRAQLLYELGYGYWVRGDFERSLETLTAALDLTADKPLPDLHLRLLNGMAIIHFQDAHYGKALEILRKLLQTHKRESTPRMNLGIALCVTGRHYEGVSQAKRAVRSEPSNFKLRYRLGHLYVNSGKLEDAVACFKDAIRLAPAIIDHYKSLAVCYHLLGWSDQAVLEIENFQSLGQQRDIFADIYREVIKGNLEKASEVLNLAIQEGRISALEASRDLNLNLIMNPKLAFKLH